MGRWVPRPSVQLLAVPLRGAIGLLGRTYDGVQLSGWGTPEQPGGLVSWRAALISVTKGRRVWLALLV